MSGNRKEVKKILDCLEAEGWRIVRKSRGWQAFPPDTALPPVTIHETNSDFRWIKNTERDARRGGFTGKFPL